MRNIIVNLLLIVLLFPGQAGFHQLVRLVNVQPVDPLWRELAPGIAYREFFLPGPNHVYVARLDRREPRAILESSIGQGRLSGGAETVREQAARYNQAINDWGQQWGSRNQVVVAINGSYFDPNSGIPWSGQVQSGWYAKRFADRQNSSGFVWTLDRRAFIGQCVQHRPDKQFISTPGQGRIPFNGINIPPGKNDLVIFTPQYDTATPLLKEGLEVLVELRTPLLILPEPEQVKGIVREVRENQGQTLLPFDHIVLSARGEAYQQLKSKINPGDEIGISQELRHLRSDCRQPNPESWTKAYASVAGGYILLVDGQVQPLGELGAVLRNPRTAIAVNERYVFFLVADGRDRLRSQGMSMVELATFARSYLGASGAIAQDGGGSSTMVVNGMLMNHPDANLADKTVPAEPLAGTAAPVPAAPVERAVANAMMMVVVQPAEYSTRFKPGQTVRLAESGPVNVRLGPGTNYAVINAFPDGTTGTILEHPLNGVQARGYFWWKVTFNAVTGWVNEASLAQR